MADSRLKGIAFRLCLVLIGRAKTETYKSFTRGVGWNLIPSLQKLLSY